MELSEIVKRIHRQIEEIRSDVPKLRPVVKSNEFKSHLLDRLVVAADNAQGCALLAEHSLAAPLASSFRSILENLFASYWGSLNDQNGQILCDAAHGELIRVMRLNLERGQAEIRHKQTNEDYTKRILNDPRIAAAQRLPNFKEMAKQSGLESLYEKIYRLMSVLAHGAPASLFTTETSEMIKADIHAAYSVLRCMHIVVRNSILENRVTTIQELECILKIKLS